MSNKYTNLTYIGDVEEGVAVTFTPVYKPSDYSNPVVTMESKEGVKYDCPNTVNGDEITIIPPLSIEAVIKIEWEVADYYFGSVSGLDRVKNLLRADSKIVCKMSQIRQWLIIESYKPKVKRRGSNIMKPTEIDAALNLLPNGVDKDLQISTWNYATQVQLVNDTTKAFGDLLGMTRDQLRIAISEAALL